MDCITKLKLIFLDFFSRLVLPPKGARASISTVLYRASISIHIHTTNIFQNSLPAYVKRWGIKKIPSSPGPRGPWDKRKKSGIFKNIQEISRKIRKNQEK